MSKASEKEKRGFMAAKVTDFGFKEETAEEVLHKSLKTNWPEPHTRFRMSYEAENNSIEGIYFWVLNELREEEGYTHFDKITDIFAASEQSSFFGAAQQRLGLQQDKVSQFLATIGKMVKELFQLVRELRIIDERLDLYKKSNDGDKPAEISLKGYWIDLVEGGAKNPASVYGMSRELGFVTLPDLFFDAPPMKSDNVQRHIDKLLFNKKVKEVLMRKLSVFLIWKERTFQEMSNRKLFTLRYLRQHYEIIRMYSTWVKPYLRNIKKLTLDPEKMDAAELVSSFEGSLVEIEVIARRQYGENTFACLSLHFDYRSRPELKFMQEGYQRGPIHVGRTIMTMRSYIWTKAKMHKYKRFRKREEFDILAGIDSSVQAAYTALGEDLEKYLYEAGEKDLAEFKKKEKHEERRSTIFGTFLAPIKGVGELFGALKPHKEEAVCEECKSEVEREERFCHNCGHEMRKPSKKEALEDHEDEKKAKEFLDKTIFNAIKRVKAAHGFVY